MTAYPAVDDSAPCRHGDADRWFPHHNTTGQSTARVANECRPCPFITECGAYALTHKVEGIWAGTTENERRAIRRKRGIVAEPLMVAGIGRSAPQPKTDDNTAPCGTVAGYFVHVRRKKATCQPCRSAMAEYKRERRAEGKAS